MAVVGAAWMEALPLPLDRLEALAFVSGLWTVWLAARNNHWTWPIGVLNSAAFVVVFWQARLYFDSGLNVFYVATGLWGWATWLFGGVRHTPKPVERVTRQEGLLVLLTVTLLTAIFWRGALAINDAAPFADALTTALSIGAQWLMMRRFLEHWAFWIAADLVYIPLYLSRGLALTAVLYAIFLLLCLRGVVEWRAILRRQQAALA